MSKANSPIKVLNTALKRVNKGWTQGHWVQRDGEGGVKVCLEGAMFGYCDRSAHGLTREQLEAAMIVEQIIEEKKGKKMSIPNFNDLGMSLGGLPEVQGEEKTTLEDVQEVLKLAIIRLETGGGIDDAELDELLKFKDGRTSV